MHVYVTLSFSKRKVARLESAEELPLEEVGLVLGSLNEELQIPSQRFYVSFNADLEVERAEAARKVSFQ